MKQGILLLAIKHSNYGRLAENLAVSLRNITDLPIALACDGPGRRQIRYSHLFSEFINVPQDYYWQDGVEQAIKAKNYLYNLTPFKETLFLDADMIWLRKDPKEIFESLKDVDFTIKNTGNIDLNKGFRANYSHWTNDLHAVKKEYKLKGKFYSLSSEVIYWKQKKEVKKIFDTCQKLYKDFKAPYLPFAGGIADELLFSIAMNKLGTPPHRDGWIPSYWQDAEQRNASRTEIIRDYYAYSIGGKVSAGAVKDFYNDLVKNAHHKAGYPPSHAFLLTKTTAKHNWLPERTHI